MMNQSLLQMDTIAWQHNNLEEIKVLIKLHPLVTWNEKYLLKLTPRWVPNALVKFPWNWPLNDNKNNEIHAIYMLN